MTLPELWFVVIAVLFTGYFMLEGFDFGVGMLFPVLGRTEVRRRVLLNTIGPVWDGNEVWLITAVGAMFAAFPAWYAAVFSGFYVLMLLILVSIIVRVVSIEWRSKIDDPRWRRACDIGIMTGSVVPAFSWGVIFSTIVAGVAIDNDGKVSTTITAYSMLGGVAMLTLFALHGIVFVGLKSAGQVSTDARELVTKWSPVPFVAVSAFAVWTQLAHGKSWTWILVAVIAGSVLAVSRLRDGWAFAATALAVVSVCGLMFSSLFPNVLPSTIDAAYNLTVENAASSDYTLQIVGGVALISMPVVMLYQGWSYWVFRKRIGVENIPAAIGLPLRG